MSSSNHNGPPHSGFRHRPRQASLHLDFLVVGGSIAGLSCAYALASSGHRVRVLEKSRKSDPTSFAGLQVSPNFSKILWQWGIGPDVIEKASKCGGSHNKNFVTGDLVNIMEWNQELIRETGSEFYCMHHQDLYDLLYRIATEAGVQVLYDAHVVEVIPGISKHTIPKHSSHSIVDPAEGYHCSCATPPSVVLANGDIFHADIVVGADGYKSIVRSSVLGRQEHGVYPGTTIFTTIFPVDYIQSDPDLREYMRPNNLGTFYLGDGDYAFIYRMGDQHGFCFHAMFVDDHVVPDNSPEVYDNWTTSYPHELWIETFKNRNANPVIQKLIQLPTEIKKVNFFELPKLEQLVHDSGTIVILGDAAHPMFPCSAEACAIAVEDAAVFGELFSRLHSRDQIPLFMEAYQDIRLERGQRVASWLKKNAEAYATLHEKPEDEVPKTKEAIEWDEIQIWEQLHGLGYVFAYNAFDAAEDWWVGWGLLSERSKQRKGGHLDIAVSIAPSSSDK